MHHYDDIASSSGTNYEIKVGEILEFIRLYINGVFKKNIIFFFNFDIYIIVDLINRPGRKFYILFMNLRQCI